MIRSFSQKKKMLYRIKKRTVAYSRLAFFVILRVGQVPFSQNFSFYFFPSFWMGRVSSKISMDLCITRKNGICSLCSQASLFANKLNSSAKFYSYKLFFQAEKHLQIFPRSGSPAGVSPSPLNFTCCLSSIVTAYAH